MFLFSIEDDKALNSTKLSLKTGLCFYKIRNLTPDFFNSSRVVWKKVIYVKCSRTNLIKKKSAQNIGS